MEIVVTSPFENEEAQYRHYQEMEEKNRTIACLREMIEEKDQLLTESKFLNSFQVLRFLYFML